MTKVSVTRRCYSLVLLAMIFLPVFAVLIGMQVERQKWKKSVRKVLMSVTSKEDLTLLVFKRNEQHEMLEWEHEREFEYRGVMYDIVIAEDHGDSIFYYCWPDHAESALNLKLNAWLAKASGAAPWRNGDSELVQQFFRTLFLTREFQIELTTSFVPSDGFASFWIAPESEFTQFLNAPPPDSTSCPNI